VNNISEETFQGYARVTGPAGIRNRLLILNTTGLSEQTARRIHSGLPGSMFASTPFGGGMVGDDAATHIAAILGIANHPNAGAVLVLGADRPRCDIVSAELAKSGKPYHAIAYDDVAHDTLRMTDLGIRAGAKLIRDMSSQRPTPQPLADLVIGLECGLSDPTSGLAANPLLGKFSDRMVAAGGTVIVGETLEWLGVEDRLASRAKTPGIAEDIRHAVLRRESIAQDAGINLKGINPNHANIESGLTTIEEKASGSSAKTGSAQISGVLKYAESPSGRGLYLMDAPAYSPESLTGFVAAGAQLIVFSTGLGNSYVSALAPTIKISGNKFTAGALPQQIDFDCSALLAGGSQEDETTRLAEHVAVVASGALTFGEILGEGSETISRFGASL
jgi:altronate dehydratase large subunit